MCDLLFAALPWIFIGIEVAIIVVHFNVKKKKADKRE